MVDTNEPFCTQGEVLKARQSLTDVLVTSSPSLKYFYSIPEIIDIYLNVPFFNCWDYFDEKSNLVCLSKNHHATRSKRVNIKVDFINIYKEMFCLPHRNFRTW